MRILAILLALSAQHLANDGLIVTRMIETNALYKLGVRNGDKLLAIGSVKVRSAAEFAEAFRLLDSSTTSVPVVYEHDGVQLQRTYTPTGK